MRTAAIIALIIALVAAAGAWILRPPPRLSAAELEQARALSLSALPPLPADPSNRWADDPRAAALGEKLFFDKGFSRGGRVSCATCHQPDRQFQDDRPVGRGVGLMRRRTPPLPGTGYNAWFFWDGRKDSLWSQALAPVESPVEHGFDRSRTAARLARAYGDEYRALFGPLDLPASLIANPPAASPLGDDAARAAWQALPAATRAAIDRAFANFGKAIAAYERTLAPRPGRFDRHVAARLAGREPDPPLSARELEGFRIFIGKGRCIQCHNGPRLSDDFFHNTGVPARSTPPTDRGRAAVIDQIAADPFNCLGPHSDAGPGDCGELRHMARSNHPFERAYKTPGLRGVANRPPYMHAGQLPTLEAVVLHYVNAPPAPAGHSEIRPLRLSRAERAALVAFLKTL